MSLPPGERSTTPAPVRPPGSGWVRARGASVSEGRWNPTICAWSSRGCLPWTAPNSSPGGSLLAGVAGFDLTFSAPKSVSLLYGLGPDEVAEAVRSSHDTATRDALHYLERHALYARRGAGGDQRVETTGAVAAAFRHRTSRAGDPQLHTHVLLANVVLGSDGRYSAPDARLIYFHGRTAGFVYQAVLRAELSSRLGVRFETSHNGLAEIEGVDKEMLRAFCHPSFRDRGSTRAVGRDERAGCRGRRARHPFSEARGCRRRVGKRIFTPIPGGNVCVSSVTTPTRWSTSSDRLASRLSLSPKSS